MRDRLHQNLPRILLIACVLALAAPSAIAQLFGEAPQARPAVSPVVFPVQELPIRFSHVRHLERGVDCQRCHTRIADSKSALDNNLPRERACTPCHSIARLGAAVTAGPTEMPEAGPVVAEKATGECSLCHPQVTPEGLVPRVRLPVPNLKFSHASHIARGTACTVCHGDFQREKVDLATRAQLPDMQTCLTCHDGKRAGSQCTLCHLSEAGGVMKSQYPGLGTLEPNGELRGAGHDLAFRTAHKFAAQNDQGFCATCHKKSFCVDCHNGRQKPMDFHAGDYVRMHAIEARRNTPDCSSCHRVQSFCQACHSRMGVAADNKGSAFGGQGGLYHPPGWTEAGLAGRGPNHHSFEAQRNIKQCASCHRESFCTKCHSAQPGSRQISPHPRNWRGSRRCQALLKRSKRMCLRCHVDAPAIDCM